jgi:hypothetical protein
VAYGNSRSDYTEPHEVQSKELPNHHGHTNPPPIRTADESTLILIKGSGDAEYARTRTDKDRLVEQFDEKENLRLWAWVGRTTQMFSI